MTPLSEVERREYSQNGEDGIIAFLASHLRQNNRSFIEIGCSGGEKNNTTALVKQGWTGVAVDCSRHRIERYLTRGFKGVRAVAMRVTPTNAYELLDILPPELAVFSLDIDSYDFHVARALLNAGFRPAIAVLEYNAAFGDRSVTVPWPVPTVGDKSLLKYFYFGCGVEAWRRLFCPLGYRFVTVDSAGVNAFFVREGALAESAMDGIAWLEWADCQSFAKQFGAAPQRWSRISHLPLEQVG